MNTDYSSYRSDWHTSFTKCKIWYLRSRVSCL